MVRNDGPGRGRERRGTRGAALGLALAMVSRATLIHADPPADPPGAFPVAPAGATPSVASPALPPPPAVFLAPRVQRPGARSKHDATGRYVPPRLRATMATVFNVHTHEAWVLEPTPAADEPRLLARLLRDRTNWEEHAIAPACLVTVRRACATLGGQRIEVISGYRSDKLNESLRKKGHHVARNSQHTLGNAMDLRLVGVPTLDLLRFVRHFHRGGTGYYPSSGFVHIDAGPVRQWRGE